MVRITLFAFFCVFLFLTGASAQDAKKEKKTPAMIEELLKLTPEEFIKRFDKNGDGKLSKDELPPVFAKAFDASDKTGDGKLDRDQVAAMLSQMRMFFGAGKMKQPGPQDVEKIIDNLLKQFDTNGDGKISRAEAKGPLIAENFDRLDQNKDGFLDRKELRVLAQQIQANNKGFGPKGGGGPLYDFDALDKNADGRLTKEELKGTPLYDRFAEIDTDQSGMIDRREFEAFLEKENAKKK